MIQKQKMWAIVAVVCVVVFGAVLLVVLAESVLLPVGLGVFGFLVVLILYSIDDEELEETKKEPARQGEGGAGIE